MFVQIASGNVKHFIVNSEALLHKTFYTCVFQLSREIYLLSV